MFFTAETQRAQRTAKPWGTANGDGHPQMTQMDAEGEKGSKVQGPKSKAFSPKPAVKPQDGAEMAVGGNSSEKVE